MTASIQADRERVLSGKQHHTAGGLTRGDLVRLPDGHIASKAKAGRVPPALAARAAAQQVYLKSKGVGKGAKTEFKDYIVRKGTVADKAIKRLVKKMI
jgi:hypothetical protein